MRMQRGWARGAAFGALATLLAVGAGRGAAAGTVSSTYNFDTSNTFSSSVGPFGTVKIEANNGTTADQGVAAGSVRITVTPTFIASLYGTPSNFGIQEFAFNTDLSVPLSKVSSPTGWSITYSSNVSTFGWFDVDTAGTGASVQNPLVITISGLGSDATIAHFLLKSDLLKNNKGEGQGPAYFAAHVKGYSSGSGSNFVAAENLHPVPEPSTIATSVIACVGIGLGAWLRRRRPSAPRD